MRTHIFALLLATSAPAALAQQVIAPPAAEAPAATAPVEERADWCDTYASWLIAMAPSENAGAPSDVRHTQHFEVELNACKVDPQLYERQTRAEAQHAAESAHG